jgi:hypothetical protein
MIQENANLKGTSQGVATMLEKEGEIYPTIVEAFVVLYG